MCQQYIGGGGMNVWPFSDIHLERGQRFLAEPPPGTDVAVVAGDLANPLFQGVQWLHANLWRRHRIPTVYIPGNHEWWSGREYILPRSEEHTSELQSLMRISYAVFCLKKTK